MDSPFPSTNVKLPQSSFKNAVLDKEKRFSAAFKRKNEQNQKENFEENVIVSILQIYIQFLRMLSQNMGHMAGVITSSLQKFGKVTSDIRT
jgi:hypothetical protein